MMHSNQTLYDSLQFTMMEVDRQIKAVKDDCEAGDNAFGVQKDPYKLKYKDGKYVLTDLIVSRANLISAMANLKASQDTSRG
jgi:hypothetical protein